MAGDRYGAIENDEAVKPGIAPSNAASTARTLRRHRWHDFGRQVSEGCQQVSVNRVKEIGDKLLTGSRLVPSLTPMAESASTVTVTVPASAPSGIYYLLACADDTALVEETSETNNCEASAAQVIVSP